MGIPEILLNIESCYSFFQDKNSTLILTCRRNLVSYYSSKGFLILEVASQALNNVPLIFQKFIHAIKISDSDYIMSCSTAITSVENTPKKIYLGGHLWDEFKSEYNNNKNDTFGLLFQKYAYGAVEKIIIHPLLIN